MRGIAPKLGLNPTMPLNAAGLMIEPSVWLPSASGTSPAATAAAEPDEDPPGVCSLIPGVDRRSRMPPGEFGRYRLAEDRRAEIAQPLDHPGVRGGYLTGVDRRPVGRRHVRVAMISLIATGMPESGPGRRAVSTGRYSNALSAGSSAFGLLQAASRVFISRWLAVAQTNAAVPGPPHLICIRRAQSDRSCQLVPGKSVQDHRITDGVAWTRAAATQRKVQKNHARQHLARRRASRI